MARLNDPVESDDELPELSTILGPRKQEYGKLPSQRQGETQNSADQDLLTDRHATSPRAVTRVSSDKPQSKKQRPLWYLKQAHVNDLLLPVVTASIRDSKIEESQSIETADSVANRGSPKRLAKVFTDYGKLAQMPANTSNLIHYDDDSSTDLSGFIVPDSASDREALVSVSPKNKSRVRKKISGASPQNHDLQISRWPQPNTRQPRGTTKVISPGEMNSSRTCLDSPPSDEAVKSELIEAQPKLDDCLTL